jgi:hypothetical protein
MRAIIVAMLLFSLPALAGESPSYRPLGQPQPGEIIEGPIPKTGCIITRWAGRSPEGFRYIIYDGEPRRDQDVALLAKWRAEGKILIFHCKSANT